MPGSRLPFASLIVDAFFVAVRADHRWIPGVAVMTAWGLISKSYLARPGQLPIDVSFAMQKGTRGVARRAGPPV